MPNIRTFDAPELSIRPSETGIEARAATARRIQSNYNEIASDLTSIGNRLGSAVKSAGDVAVSHIDHEQISAGAAYGAKLFDDLTKQKDDAIKQIDPKAPDYGAQVDIAVKKWREENLEPALEKFKGGFSTEKSQQWAEHFVDQTRQHMFVHSAADVSTAARIGVTNSITTFTNQSANTAYRDPSSTQTMLDMAEHSVDGLVSSSPLRGVQAAAVRAEVLQKAKQQIVKAGYFGAISKAADPEKVAEEWSRRFPEYVTPDEVSQFARAAKAQNKANQLTDRQLEVYGRQQMERKADDALSKNWTDSVAIDENGHATIKPDFYKNVLDIERQYPGARTSRAEAMIKWAQSEQRERREVIITDKTTQSSLYDGLFRTDKPTTDVDILKASAEKKLDGHDTQTLLSLYRALEEKPLRGPIYQGTMEAVKGIYGTGEKGHEAYAKFLQSFLPEYLKKQRDGSLPPNALDVRDENSMISQAMKPFRLSSADKMMDTINKRIGMGAGDLTINLTGEGKTVTGVQKIDLPPDAKKAGDGHWYVQRDGKFFRVDEK